MRETDTGQTQDSTGLMYYGARYYDPALARFVSPDSIAPGIGSAALNRYAYVNNNPINLVDPSGHNAEGSPWDARRENRLVQPSRQATPSSNSDSIDQVVHTLTNLHFGAPPSLPLPAPLTDEPERWAQHVEFCRNYPNFVACGPPINDSGSWYVKFLSLGTDLVIGTVEPFGSAVDGGSCLGGEGTGCLGVLLPFLGGTFLKELGPIGARNLPMMGPTGNPDAFAPPITITKNAVDSHILPRHFPGGGETAGKSVFNAGESVSDLVAYGQRVAPAQSYRNNWVRIVDAQRVVGTDASTGNLTTVYTIVTSSSGNLVTMHPGVP